MANGKGAIRARGLGILWHNFLYRVGHGKDNRRLLHFFDYFAFQYARPRETNEWVGTMDRVGRRAVGGIDCIFLLSGIRPLCVPSIGNAVAIDHAYILFANSFYISKKSNFIYFL